MKYRTHSCGELTKKEVGKKVILSGFVDSVRTHGKIGFLNIRDRYGITHEKELSPLKIFFQQFTNP